MVAFRAGVFLLAFVLSFQIWGAEYPTQNGNSDLLFIDDPYVELQLKLDAIRTAKKSVKIVSLAQGIDDGGLQMLSAIEDARKNGLSTTQYIYDGWVSKMFFADSKGHAASSLVNSEVACPAGVICLGNKEKKKLGITNGDFFHQKLLIIDEGTPNEKIFFGGRNNSEFDFFGQDAGFVIRPIDPSKPHVGKDIVQYYDKTYGFLKEKVGEVPPKPISKKTEKAVKRPLPQLLTIDEQKNEYAALKTILEKPPIENEPLQSFQFRPKSSQLLSNDTMIGAATTDVGHTLEERLKGPNDIAKKVESLIKDGKKATFISYVLGLPPTLQEATKTMLSNGGNLEVWTNGRTAHRDIFVKNPVMRFFGKQLGVTASALDYTINNAIPLMETAEKSGGSARIHLRDSDKVNEVQTGPQKNYAYQHIKAAIVDDRYVATGCDNFTVSSWARNDEFVLLFDSPKLAEMLVEHLEKQKAKGIYKTADLQEIRRQKKDAPLISRCVQSIIRANY